MIFQLRLFISNGGTNKYDSDRQGKKKRLTGGGAKPQFEDIEKFLFEWIYEQ